MDDEKRTSQAPATKGATRRELLTSVGKAAGVACMFGLGLSAVVQGQARGSQAQASHGQDSQGQALRPPGALPEQDFLAACSRCGLCVRACPYDTLILPGAGGPVANGTPFFHPRSVACEMCEDIPCVKACPTGALDPGLTDITKAQMGVAVLTDHQHCLNAQGLRCDVCYRVCPLVDEAITLEQSHNSRTERHAIFMPTVHPDLCTGCGKCEKSCVLPESAIRVFPRGQVMAKLGDHYRLGWEEKAKNGKALLDGIIDLPDRGYTPPPLNGGFKP